MKDSRPPALRILGSHRADPADLDPEILKTLGLDYEEGQPWFFSTWQSAPPRSGGIEIRLRLPQEAWGTEDAATFFAATAEKLEGAFAQYAQERNWPEPRVTLLPESGETWSYSVQHPNAHLQEGLLRPNKLLTVGESNLLGQLLGLETFDPVFGLPAKWISYSQLEKAQDLGLSVFDCEALVAAHCLNSAMPCYFHSVGYWELQQWLSQDLSHASGLIIPLLEERPGELLTVVRKMIEDQLWLPNPAQFCERLSQLIASERSASLQVWTELLRKDVVESNIGRWLDSHGQLRVIEWKGSREEGPAEQTRLLQRLATALAIHSCHQTGQPPVLVSQFEERLELASALATAFPELRVLSWPEIPATTQIDLVATIKSNFEVAATNWPSLYFSNLPREESEN